MELVTKGAIGPVPVDSDDIALAARAKVPVLITSSSAADRERCAWLIHQNSIHRDRPFAVFRCGGDRALPESRHVADCADDDLRATLTCTEDVSLFVDDVERLSPRAQRQLSSFLEAHPDGCLIAGATPSLFGKVESNRFDERLFYRLNVVHLRLAGGPAT